MRAMRPALLIAVALLGGATSAHAQERTPEMRQALIGLTRVLGESHALRQACEGREDQQWRSKMARLMDAEQPPPELEEQMKASFNAGFAEMKRLYPACGEAARVAMASTAARGRELSNTLSHAKHRVGVMPVQAEPEEGVTTEPSPG